MEKVIEVRELTKQFGSLTAVDNLQLDVYQGDVFGFLGPNGAGKSTTIRMILSLIKPDSGTIKVFGLPLPANRAEIMSKIGCIVEKPDFYKYLDAEKNLEILSRFSSKPVSRGRIGAILEFVGLSGRGKDKVSGYSHGMKQRLGLAQALLHDPDLIILDEPTTGLDPQGIIDIRQLILYLSREKGKTIFLSSHILHELELVASRLAILNKGKLVLQGAISDLLNEHERLIEIRTDNPEKAARVLAESWAGNTSADVKQGILRLQSDYQRIPELVAILSAQGVDIYGVESRRRLEDLFLQLTESAERMQIR